jgi:hypothetical protein
MLRVVREPEDEPARLQLGNAAVDLIGTGRVVQVQALTQGLTSGICPQIVTGVTLPVVWSKLKR